MQSRKEKLPRGRSYPLKPSRLASAVEDAGLASPVELTRWDEFDSAFQARFYPDGSWAGIDGEYFWVSCKAVSSDKAEALRVILEREAIPRFVKWAKGIEALDIRSPIRREKQTFTYPYPPLDD